MSVAVPVEALPWSRQRWITTILVGVAAQAGSIFWLAERPKPGLTPEKFSTAIHLVTDTGTARRWNELPALTDPTVFALPGQHGFSGSAWLRFTPPEYPLTDWSEPNRWLELNAATLGETFARFVLTNHSAPLRIADKPAPRLPLDELSAPNMPMRAHSLVRIEGDLARRALLAPLAPPSWPHGDVLGRSEVQLLVDANGFAVSTVLVAESGLPAADQHALELARAARFNSLRRPKGENPSAAATLLTRGRMIFLWHTLPALQTNAPPPTP